MWVHQAKAIQISIEYTSIQTTYTHTHSRTASVNKGNKDICGMLIVKEMRPLTNVHMLHHHISVYVCVCVWETAVYATNVG